MRTISNWNADWRCRRTPNGEWTNTTLPWTWNEKDGQDGGNDYYRGQYEFEKHFKAPTLSGGERLFLEIPAASASAEVLLNGQFLARHMGGYSAFRVDLTDALEEENCLTILVDNAPSDAVYPQKADFTFYGGLYRGVNLIKVPAEHFELLKDGTPGIKVTPEINLETGTATVIVETWQNAGPVDISVAGQTITAESVDGCARAVFAIPQAHLWNGLEDPYLYTAEARLASGDAVRTRFGIRSFSITPEGFFLNGHPYPLRGVSKHQDRAAVGNAVTNAMLEEDMAIIRELGANAVRLAHYQHPQYFYDLCDENGILVWAEIPMITAHLPNGAENARTQMRELITQCYNHPSIICWGLSNEITAASPVTDALMEEHRQLNSLCHRLDATRPTTMAHAFMLEMDSPLIEIPDTGAYNLYFGWYLGDLEQNDRFFDEYHAKFPERAIGFSEYGADANPAFQTAKPDRGDYTEQFQCLYHEHVLNCIEARPWLWCSFVWNLFDFAADGRDEGGNRGVNQKGLVTMDRHLKKDAFYLYKAAWSQEPFVHLCGRRYVNRAEPVTEIKVYSNQPAVTLLVDGQVFAEQSSRRIFTFCVPITGEHAIEAISGTCRDAISIRKTDAPDPAYQFQKEEIVNWFDRDQIRPDFFSIEDTLGEMLAHPQAGALVQRIIDQASKSRGDVAQATSNNANLMKMMSGMRLSALLKQAGDAISHEQAQALNDALQRIPKS